MLMQVLKKSLSCWVLLCGAWLLGCSEPAVETAVDFIIRTKSYAITSGEFSEELDLKRAAYPYNINENPAEYNEMVIHLVEMLSEEIVLLSAAQDKGVTVTDPEAQLAEQQFKQDYPGDSFDQILLKNALSYSFWKKRFKRNLIMDKFIDQDLRQKIEITSQDIVAFYNAQNSAKPENPDEKTRVLKKIGNELELVSRLRLQKAQDLYDEWAAPFWQDYPVEINKEKLKTFLIGMEKNKES